MSVTPIKTVFVLLLIVLAGGIVHQRSAYLKVKAQRDGLREERGAWDLKRSTLEVQLKKLSHEHDARLELVTQWIEFQGTAAFRGDFNDSKNYRSVFAKVVHVTPIPDPLTSPYKECLSEVEIMPFEFGEEVSGERMIGVITVFSERQLTGEAALKVGDIVHCDLVPEDHIGDEIKKIQRVTTVEDFTLDTYYLASVSRLGKGAPERVPVSTFSSTMGRAEAIASDIARIDKLLAGHDGDWAKWHDETQRYRDMLNERMITEGEDITIDERITFRQMKHLSHTPNGAWPEPQLAMMRSMNEQLAARGIDLIVVPLPEKEITNWQYFIDEHPEDGVIMPYRLYFYRELLKSGIEMVDTAPALAAAWDDYQYVFYDGDDSHPADGAIQVTADIIAERLARYGFEPQVAETWRVPFSYSIPPGFDLFPESAMTEERYEATRVLSMDLSGVRDNGVHRSPMLLLSDSFGSVPVEYHVRNGNFVSHLSARVGIPMHHKQVHGGGPRMLRHLAGDPDVLSMDRKVCIFLFSEDYMFRHVLGNTRFNWMVEQIPEKAE